MVFRIGHLGDTVIALPALWAIRENFPSARLTLLTNRDTQNPNYISPADVIPVDGLIDQVIAYPTNLTRWARIAAFAKLIRKLRAQKFDALIYLMPRIRNARQIDRDHSIFRLCGIDRILGTEYLKQNSLPGVIPKPTPSVDQEGIFLLDMLASDGLEIDKANPRTDLGITEKEKATAAEWFDRFVGRAEGRRLIAIAPGSKWRSKLWPEERYETVIGNLINEHQAFPLIFGGAEDRGLAMRLLEKWGTGVNAAGELKVREAAAVLGSCDLYVGNDTGTMHLAAAMGTPCVGIFAAIDWIGRWTPLGAKSVVFRKRVACEGCLTPDCFNDNECLDLVTEDEVFNACVSLLDAKLNRENK